MLVILLTFGLLAPTLTQNSPSMLFYLLVVGLCASVFWLPKLRAFFENPVSRFLGHVSFPLYLVQGPLLHSFSVYALRWMGKFSFPHNVVNLAVCLISLPAFLLAAVAFTPINDGAIIVARRFGVFFVKALLTLK